MLQLRWSKLEGGKIVECSLEDYFSWVTRGADEDPQPWQVAIDDVGDAHISTVFIHGFSQFPLHGMKNRPTQHRFETMIFGGAHNDSVFKYPTIEDARDGHARIVDLLERNWRVPENPPDIQ